MTRNDFTVAALGFVSLTASACVAGPETDDELVGAARSAAFNENALNGNALNGNALNGNGLQPTALTPSMLGANALRPSTMSAEALSALRDPGENGDLSRQLLKYAVSCAFTSSQSFELTWTDERDVVHVDAYTGLLGLAPGWSSHALSSAGQQWVSACLISRVNYFGVSVTLSSRGSLPELAASSAEQAAFTRMEGAFWGNVFAATPVAYACDHVPNDEHSRSRDRVCAAGYVDGSGGVLSCGIIQRVGSCVTTCSDPNRGDGYAGCSAGAGQSSSPYVITVFLE